MTSRRCITYPTRLDALGELDRQIVALSKAGKDYTEIGHTLGKHPRTISDRVKHINALVQPGKPPVIDLAQHGRFPISKTPDAINPLDQKIIDLYRQGLEFQDISDRLGGISRQTISTRIMRLRDNLGENLLPRRRAMPQGERRNTAEKSKPTDRAGRVRCRGGCDQHFDSPDRCRIRICPKCKAKQRDNSDGYTENRLFTA